MLPVPVTFIPQKKDLKAIFGPHISRWKTIVQNL
jgi:hypothetical protein